MTQADPEPPKRNGSGRRLIEINVGGSGMTGTLKMVVLVWLMIAMSTAVMVLLSLFTGRALPDLDILERIIGWLGAPALIVIYAALDRWKTNGKEGDDEDQD